MVFRIASSPYTHNQRQTSRIMMLVLLAALPGIAAQLWFFGWGTLFQIILAAISAIAAEAGVLKLRKQPIVPILKDNSALLTGLLLAVSIPPLAPWWMVVLGTVFAVIIAKQLYGGLGQNPFNPAMIGYVVLLISFPVQMTSWLPPHEIAATVPGFFDALNVIFSGHTVSGGDMNTLRMGIDGISQATPLDTFKTSLHAGHTVEQVMQYPIYSGVLAGAGWQWVNLAWLAGGIVLLWQGAIRWHPYVLEEMAAAQNNDVDAFDKLLFKHIGHVGSNKVRSFWLGLTRGLTSATPTGDATKRYYQHLNRLSANLALLSDVSMAVLGGSLKRRERISARLGDVLSQIFLASAVLKRYDDEGRQEADLPLVHWGVQDAMYQAEQAIDDLLANFPNRFVAGALRVVIFPTGRHHLAPSDKLDHKVAKILQVPSATRSRIGRGQYLAPTPHNPVGLLEEALLDVMAADPIHQKICKQLSKNLPFTRLDELAKQALAGGIISKDEAALLVKAEESRLRSINVDDFEPDELATQPVKLPEKHRKPEAA